MQATNENDKKNENEQEPTPPEADGEEFQITVKKLDLPVKPRGVLAE